MRQLIGWPASVPRTRNNRFPSGPTPALLMVKKQFAHAIVVCGARDGMSERKELTPNGPAATLTAGGGDHRKQPRAGAGRAISFGDGTSSDCVDVYVRCCSFLLKRTAATAARETEAGDEGMEGFSASDRSSAVREGRASGYGARAGSVARAGAESAKSSEAKRFAWCSAEALLLRVVRCAAMRSGCDGCDECEDDECGFVDCDAVASASRGMDAEGCDCGFDFDGCPLGTGPLRVLSPAGPPSLFSRHSCSHEHSGPAPRT